MSGNFEIGPFVEEAFDVSSGNNNQSRVRCPGCNALLAEYIGGVYLRRCYSCWGKILIVNLPEVKVTTTMTCIHDDEAHRVICPNCCAPLGEFIVGVYKTICFHCKWGGIITRSSDSLVQSHQTMQEPSRDVGWRKEDSRQVRDKGR